MSSQDVKTNKVWDITKIVLNVIFYVFIAILLIFSIANLGVKEQGDIPSIFGNGFLTVQTDSMDGDQKDSFTINDLVTVKKVTDKNRDKVVSELKVGDTISYLYYSEQLRANIINSHRIVDVGTNSEGGTYFVTQGDKAYMDLGYRYNPDDENPNMSHAEVVSTDQILAVYTGKWTGFGKTMKFLQTSNGFLLCIVLPAALFFVFEALMLVMNFMKMKQTKSEEEKEAEHQAELQKIQEDLEKEKERMREEIRKEMEKEKEAK